jgi:hypothetical protein
MAARASEGDPVFSACFARKAVKQYNVILAHSNTNIRTSFIVPVAIEIGARFQKMFSTPLPHIYPQRLLAI